jgi:thiamine kinase-like enzyme
MVAGEERDEVLAVLRGVPALAGVDPARVAISQLGGLSHRNLKIETPAGHFVLQIPMADPHGPDRRQALEATPRASRLGIGAELVHAEPQTGLLVTRWVGDAETLTHDRFRADARIPDEVASLLRRWHRSGERLRPAIDHYDALDRLRDGLNDPIGSARLYDAAGRARAELRAQASPAPIHGDPDLENFLVSPAGLVLIDWEYAGMGDPGWDLGYLAHATEMTPSEEIALLASYAVPEMTLRRLRLNRMVAAALSALWLKARMQRGNSPDLSSAIENRLRQAEQLSITLYPDAGSR